MTLMVHVVTCDWNLFVDVILLLKKGTWVCTSTVLCSTSAICVTAKKFKMINNNSRCLGVKADFADHVRHHNEIDYL